MAQLLENAGFQVLGCEKVGHFREINNMLLGLSLFSRSKIMRALFKMILLNMIKDLRSVPELVLNNNRIIANTPNQL